jgi:hypothetical protein
VPPLDVAGTTPVLLRAEGERVQGEVWLVNNSEDAVVVKSAHLSVQLPSGPEEGLIQLPSDAAVPGNTSKRLLISTGMQPFIAPGTYDAAIRLIYPDDSEQSIPATFLIVTLFRLGIVADRQVFTGVKAGAKVKGKVVVLNTGNVPITVSSIPDEPLLEVTTAARVVALGNGGVAAVQPATGLKPLAGKVKFTNDKPEIPVGGWADVNFQLTTPAGLGSNLHVRVLPRIATERFTVDLLT